MTLHDLNTALAAEDARSRAVRLRLLRAKLDQQVLAFDLVGAAETERAIMRLEEEPRIVASQRRVESDEL